MKYYYSLLRRRTAPARWGMMIGAIAVILMSAVLLPLVQTSELREMYAVIPTVSTTAARFVLIVAFVLELFRSVPLVMDDRFGHLLPEQERKPLLAALLSVLFSALLYSLCAVVCSFLDELLRTGAVQQSVRMLTENMRLHLLVFLPAVIVQFFFSITLVMCLQLFLRRLAQKNGLVGRVPHSAGRLLTFLVALGVWVLFYRLAMKALFRFPLVLDLPNGVIHHSVFTAEAWNFSGNLFLWPVTMTETAQTVLSVPVLLGLVVFIALQWVVAVILSEDHLDWEV